MRWKQDDTYKGRRDSPETRGRERTWVAWAEARPTTVSLALCITHICYIYVYISPFAETVHTGSYIYIYTHVYLRTSTERRSIARVASASRRHRERSNVPATL